MRPLTHQTELQFAVDEAEWLVPAKACRYRRGFLGCDEASELLQRLRHELPWKQQAIALFGREVMQPRLVCWQADPKVDYGYSGIRLLPAPWHPLLAGLRQRLNAEFGQEFNAVLANAYRGGNDSMGWHADDEPELGREPVLASISLGAERMFRWRENVSGRSSGMRLEHGSLLLLEGDFQRLHQHSVPKARRVTGLRINLTFRRVYSMQR